MKLYEFEGAPSPRKVRLFAAEKGLSLPTVSVDLRAGEQFSDWYRQIQPRCTVPALALEDGTVIGDSEAICRYLEAQQPDPPLLGETALEQARIAEWLRRIELAGYGPVADALRNQSPAFAGRALPGPDPIEQIPALAERGRWRAQRFWPTLDAALAAGGPWLLGDRLSAADLFAFATLEFAQRVELGPDQELPALASWQQRLRQRSTVQA